MMYFLTKIILVLCVILYSMDQASSIKCFDCLSRTGEGEDCYDKPNQKKFEKTCPDYYDLSGNTSKVLLSAYSAGSTNILNALSLDTPDIVGYVENTQKGISTHRLQVDECWKYKATDLITATEFIKRVCGCKAVTDEVTKISLFLGRGLSVQSIHRCDTDLCNSSDILSVGFFYSIFPLFFAYFINF